MKTTGKILMLCMILLFWNVPAWSADKYVGDNNFTILKNTISSAQSGDIIIILGDYTFTAQIKLDKSITIKASEDCTATLSDDNNRVFQITAKTGQTLSVMLEGLQIANGNSSASLYF